MAGRRSEARPRHECAGVLHLRGSVFPLKKGGLRCQGNGEGRKACPIENVKKWLERPGERIQILSVRTISYPVRFSEEEYATLKREAIRRKKTLADLIRDLIIYGLPALPPMPESYEAVQEVWDNLGPTPEVIYENVPKD